MGSNAVDILARLKLNAQNFSAELQRELGQAEQKFGSSGSVIGRNIASGVGGGIQQAAAQVPILGGAISGLSGVALGAAASVGAIVAVIGKGIEEAEAWEKSVRQLNAVLNAGGNRTGLTRKELTDFAADVESSFAIAEEEVIKAESALATFDGVSGEVFKRAIKDAGDLAAVYGGDLSSNTEKLGTILQNMAQGNVEGLRKGFKFLGTETLTVIENLAKAGKTSEATERFLDALESKVGGAGEANAKGVSGAMFRLKDAIGDATREFVIQTGIYSAVESGLDSIATKAGNAAKSLSQMNSLEITGSFLKWLSDNTGGPGGSPFGMLGTMATVAMGIGGGRAVAADTAARHKAILDDVLGAGGFERLHAITAADAAKKENDRIAAKNARDRADQAAAQSRTPQQVFQDFQAALARQGVQHASGRYGYRSAADQAEIHASGESPLDGVLRPSRHQAWQAFDPSRATANDAAARRAAAEVGLKDFQIVNESGGRKHYEWKGASGTKADAASAMLEQNDQAAAERKRRDEEHQKAIDAALKASKEQLSVDMDGVRYADLRAQGLDRQAELEEQLDAMVRKHNEELAKLPASERVVTAGLQEQLSIAWDQSKAYADLIAANGDRATMTEAVRKAEEDAEAAMLDSLETARAMAKTDADRKAIEEAILQIKLKLKNAGEDGKQAADDEKKAAAARKKVADDAAQATKKAQDEMLARERESVSDLADFYERAFRSGGKSIWKDFEDEGMHIIAMIAAKWTLALISGQQTSLPGILSQLTADAGGRSSGPFNLLGSLNGLFGGGAGAGAGGGAAGGGGELASMLAHESGHATGAASSLAGAASMAGPIGAAIAINQGLAHALHLNPTTALFAGVGGAALIKLLSATKKGSATLGLDSFGSLGVGSTSGNSKKRIDAASQGIDGLAATLQQIADQLGGTVSGSGSLSLGLRKGNWRLDTAGLGRTKKGAGVLDFGTDEDAAIAAAISEALKDGVIAGISDASKHILASGQDLQKAIEKASLIEAIPKALKARLDPVGGAVDDLNEKWTKTIAALKEGGATTEQMTDAQKLYNLELADAKDQANGAAQGLKDFLDSIAFGSSSPFSLRDQEAKAQAALKPFLDQIDAHQSIDQGKYQDAASQYLDIERQLGGSTGDFFDKLASIQDYTNRAIADIDNAKPIRTFADPFAETTASNTGAMADMLEQTNGLLIDIRGALGGLGGGSYGEAFIGSGAGFTSQLVNAR